MINIASVLCIPNLSYINLKLISKKNDVKSSAKEFTDADVARFTSCVFLCKFDTLNTLNIINKIIAIHIINNAVKINM